MSLNVSVSQQYQPALVKAGDPKTTGIEAPVKEYASFQEMTAAAPLPAGLAKIGTNLYASDGRFLTKPGNSAYWKSKLPNFSAAYAAMKKGVASVNVALYGDSLTAGIHGATGTKSTSYPAFLAAMTGHNSNSVMGSNSGGAVSLFSNYDNRVSFTGTWAYPSSYSLGNQPFEATSAGAAMTFQPSSPVDTIDVYYETAPAGYGYGSMTVSTSAGIGTNGSISCIAGTTYALAKTTVTLSELSTKPIVITNGPSAAIIVLGFVAYNSKAPAINLISAGIVGATAAILGSNTYDKDTLNALKFVAPSLTIGMIGANDMANITNTPTATFQTNYQAIITAAKLSGDFVIVTPPPVDISVATLANQQSVVSSCYTLATANNCGLIDVWSESISYAYQNSLGNMDADKEHRTASGYQDMAGIVLDSGIFY